MNKISKFSMLLLLTSFILAAGKLSAQTFDDVRKAYSDFQTIKKQSLNGERPVNCFSVNQKVNYPGSGQLNSTVDFWFDLKDDFESGGDSFEYVIKFASRSYTIAEKKYYEENLYDESGNLIFLYARYYDYNDNCAREMRAYFSKNSLIKIIMKVDKLGGTNFVQEYNGTTIPAANKEDYNRFVKLSDSAKSVFKSLSSSFTNPY